MLSQKYQISFRQNQFKYDHIFSSYHMHTGRGQEIKANPMPI